MSDGHLDELVARLDRARTITAFTGAGVSRASGVPTFRGPDGLWRNFRAEELATPQAFARDPALVWEWYDWRRQLVARCEPNAAHDVLAQWSRQRPGVTVVTQNVDGLHERAGTAHVVRLHGSLWEVACWDRCEAGLAPRRDDRVPLPQLPPRCGHCGGLLRPAVVWFGEMLDGHSWRAAEQAAACDVFFAVGTSSLVYPAASLVATARRHGAFIVEVNVDATPQSSVADINLRVPAERAFADLHDRWRSRA
ncbi:MAG: NAD-dependent deacylase [Vicinamibacterales bacterium]